MSMRVHVLLDGFGTDHLVTEGLGALIALPPGTFSKSASDGFVWGSSAEHPGLGVRASDAWTWTTVAAGQSRNVFVISVTDTMRLTDLAAGVLRGSQATASDRFRF